MSAGLTSTFMQGHLNPVAQGHVQTAFEYIQSGRFGYFCGQPAPVLSHLTKVVPDVLEEPPLFQFVPLFLLLATTEKSQAPSSLHPPFRNSYMLIRSSEPSLLQAKQFQLSQPFFIGEMLHSFNYLYGYSLYSFKYVHISLVLRSPEYCIQYFRYGRTSAN